MARPPRLALVLLAALSLAPLLPSAAAHEEFDAGKYSIEVGWLYEPAVADQPNSITIRVTDTTGAGDGTPVTEDVSLTPIIALGSDSKTLAVESSDEDPGMYFAAVTPTKEGDYSVHITGTIAGVQVDHTTKLQAVEAPSEGAFPVTHGTVREVQDAQGMLWIAAGVAAALALLALILSIVALSRKPKPVVMQAGRGPVVGTPVRAVPPSQAPVRRNPPPPGSS
jgi:hypothetical protein